jgi:uncharacterized membrane protein HdeD (DUF308 family)
LLAARKKPLAFAVISELDANNIIQRIPKRTETMIIAGIILLLVGYFVSLPVPFDQIAIFLGWILVVVGVILAILGGTGRAVAGRRYWY